MAYSGEDDLLIGDLALSPVLDKGKFIDEAAEEIDAKLGFVYKLPLTGLAVHEALLLKGINNKLASGRLIMAVAVGGEDTAVHAYALRLVTEATQELLAIANGAVDLTAERADPTTEEGRGATTPSVTNLDGESGVEAFYKQVMGGTPWTWQPGPVL